MKTDRLNQKRNLKLLSRLKDSLIAVVLMIILSCNRKTHLPVIVSLNNFSSHDDGAEGYAELLLPLNPDYRKPCNAEKSDHIKWKEAGYLIADRDTLSFFLPTSTRNYQYFKQTGQLNHVPKYSSFIIKFDEPLRWSSLSSMDSLLQSFLNGTHSVYYFDCDGKTVNFSTHSIVFKYFFDGKEVNASSDSFYRKMALQYPPVIP